MSSWNSAVISFVPASARSTCSSPSTCAAHGHALVVRRRVHRCSLQVLEDGGVEGGGLCDGGDVRRVVEDDQVGSRDRVGHRAALVGRATGSCAPATTRVGTSIVSSRSVEAKRASASQQVAYPSGSIPGEHRDEPVDLVGRAARKPSVNQRPFVGSTIAPIPEDRTVAARSCHPSAGPEHRHGAAQHERRHPLAGTSSPRVCPPRRRARARRTRTARRRGGQQRRGRRRPGPRRRTARRHRRPAVPRGVVADHPEPGHERVGQLVPHLPRRAQRRAEHHPGAEAGPSTRWASVTLIRGAPRAGRAPGRPTARTRAVCAATQASSPVQRVHAADPGCAASRRGRTPRRGRGPRCGLPHPRRGAAASRSGCHSACQAPAGRSCAETAEAARTDASAGACRAADATSTDRVGFALCAMDDDGPPVSSRASPTSVWAITRTSSAIVPRAAPQVARA